VCDVHVTAVFLCRRFALGECGALKSQLPSDPRFHHIERMLKSSPLAGDSSDDD